MPDHPVTRLHVVAIVRTCQRFPDGARALLDAVEIVMGRGDTGFSRLEAAIQDYWP